MLVNKLTFYCSYQ